MPKYELEIGVSAKTGKGGSTGDLRQQVQQSKELASINKKVAKEFSKGGSTIPKNLDSSIKKLIMEQQKQIQELKKNTTELQRQRNTQSGRGIGRGGGGHDVGGGIGSMGASLPIAGLLLGAAGFIVSQVFKVGQAYISKMGEQVSTAGIAGTKHGGIGGYFDAAQTGQLVKARRMSYGKYQGAGVGGSDSAVDYAKRFGLGADEIGRHLGLMDVMSRGKGGKSFSDVIGIAQKGGIETEIPLLINAISGSLEEAVKDGVNASDMAREMAQEVAMLTKYSPNGTARSAIEAQRSLMGVQKNVARGQFGDLSGFRMFEVARGQIRDMMSGKGNQKTLQGLLDQGIVSKDQIDAFKKNGTLLPTTERFITQAYLNSQPEAVRNAFMEDIVKKFGGSKGLSGDKLAQAFSIAQDYGMPGADDPHKFKMMYRAAEARMRGEPSSIKESDIQKGAKEFKENTTGGKAFSIRSQEIKKESMLLQSGGVGEKAAESVFMIENSLMSLAGKMSGPIAKSIDKMNAGFEILGNQLDSIVEKIQKLADPKRQKSIWERVMDII